jgi:hypothetical protein
MNVTYFAKLTDPKTLKHLPLKVILDGIKSPRHDSPVKEIVEKIRTTPDKELRDELKKTLPVVCFSGLFNERRASALREYSRLIALDFDGLECPDDFKEELIKNPYIYSAWFSPSGNGVKALVRVASDNHLGHALALLKTFPEADHNAVKDVNRAAFMSIDDALYFNPDSQIYHDVIIPRHTDEDKYTALKKWLENKGSAFVNGQRNTFITKLSAAANRFGVDKEFLKNRIEEEFLKGSDFSKREMELTVTGIYERYVDQYNTVLADEVWTDKKVNDVLAVDFKVNDIIRAKDVENDLVDDFVNGSKMGDTTYFPVLDNHFRWLNGEVTTLTGISNSGKSSMLNQLLIFRAAFEGKKSALVSMEQYPPTFFYKEIIRTIIGKPLEKNDPHRMSMAEYKRGLDWVHEHFFFLYPEKDDPTVEWVLARFSETLIKHGIDQVVVDPLNSLSHDYKGASGRDDRYIATMLNKYQRFALQSSLPFVLVAHPRGIGKKEDGTYKEPSADEISGGVSFWQRSDNILCFHRPNLPLDFTDPACTLRSLKIKKQSICGVPGYTSLMYDRKTGRYYENGFNPLTKFML